MWLFTDAGQKYVLLFNNYLQNTPYGKSKPMYKGVNAKGIRSIRAHRLKKTSNKWSNLAVLNQCQNISILWHVLDVFCGLWARIDLISVALSQALNDTGLNYPKGAFFRQYSPLGGTLKQIFWGWKWYANGPHIIGNRRRHLLKEKTLFWATLGKSWNRTLNFCFRIVDAFVKFEAKLWADLVYICISDCVKKNWAQTLQSGFSIGWVDSTPLPPFVATKKYAVGNMVKANSAKLSQSLGWAWQYFDI